MVEILCAALPGAGPEAIGHFFFAIDPTRFRDEGAVEADVDALAARLRATRPIDPAGRCWSPGTRSARRASAGCEGGIPLSRSVIEDMRTVARGSGVPFDL